jgi:hypothetical protein
VRAVLLLCCYDASFDIVVRRQLTYLSGYRPSYVLCGLWHVSTAVVFDQSCGLQDVSSCYSSCCWCFYHLPLTRLHPFWSFIPHFLHAAQACAIAGASLPPKT